MDVCMASGCGRCARQFELDLEAAPSLDNTRPPPGYVCFFPLLQPQWVESTRTVFPLCPRSAGCLDERTLRAFPDRPLTSSRAGVVASMPTSSDRSRVSAKTRLPSEMLVHVRRGNSHRELSATSGRSPVKKIVSPTTGSKVQQTQVGNRSRRRILRSGHSSPSDASRHQGPTVCLLVTGSNWRCRPVAVCRARELLGGKRTLLLWRGR